MNKPKASVEKKKAWKAFSDYIRARDRWTCYTCGRVVDKYHADAGHLISRYWAGTLFDEMNVHCQCKSCNILHENDPEIYKRKWVAEHGQLAFDELYRRSKLTVKRTAQDYIDLRKAYEAISKRMIKGE